MGADDDYQVISVRVSWAGLSLVFFGLTMASDYLLHLQPWRPRQIWAWPLMKPLAVLALSSLGFVAGWLGLRFSDSRGLAKAGMFLNGVPLAIVLSIALVWGWIVAWR